LTVISPLSPLVQHVQRSWCSLPLFNTFNEAGALSLFNTFNEAGALPLFNTFNEAITRASASPPFMV